MLEIAIKIFVSLAFFVAMILSFGLLKFVILPQLKEMKRLVLHNTDFEEDRNLFYLITSIAVFVSVVSFLVSIGIWFL